MFANQLPSFLDQELQVANNLGIVPSSITDQQFDEIIAQGRVKWGINVTGKLLFIPEFFNSQEIYHTVLFQGNSVLAAGLADIVGIQGRYLLLWLSNYSGHYRPTAASLEFGKEAFQRAGIDISQADFEIFG